MFVAVAVYCKFTRGEVKSPVVGQVRASWLSCPTTLTVLRDNNNGFPSELIVCLCVSLPVSAILNAIFFISRHRFGRKERPKLHRMFTLTTKSGVFTCLILCCPVLSDQFSLPAACDPTVCLFSTIGSHAANALQAGYQEMNRTRSTHF